MRKVRFTLAAKFLILAVILVCGLLATSADAAYDPTATALLFTYYDVRGLSDGGLGVTDNYFTVVNASTNWTQAHVRVRTGDCSVELLDFDIMLSPNDVFSFDLSKDGDGIAFSSKDAETIANTKELAPFLQTLPGGAEGIAFSTNASSPFYEPNLTSLILTCGTCPTRGEITQAEANKATEKGYVEVIMEGLIADCASKTSPDDPKHGYCRPTADGHYAAGVSCSSDVTNLVDITEHTLIELTRYYDQVTDEWIDGLCSKSISKARPTLSGRVYYASVSPDFTAVPRLAHINAEALGWQLPSTEVSNRHIILHENTYLDELASDKCLIGQHDESCFAYNEATTNLSNELNDPSYGGADDMNYCFYQDLVYTGDEAGLGVQNKFGAGATFGPTMADITWRDRDADLDDVAEILTDFISHSGSGYFAQHGLGNDGIEFLKQEVHSHFFFSPAPAEFDIRTALAFIFPLKHFINETPQLGSIIYYNMDELPCTAPSSGFISPGLPGKLVTKEEAFLEYLTANCGYAEGWVHIGDIVAHNETQTTDHCTVPGVKRSDDQLDTGDCIVFNPVRMNGAADGRSPYVPAWTGAVFIIGPDTLSSSLDQIHGQFPYCENEDWDYSCSGP